MPYKPLSNRKIFESGLVLSTDYDAAPGHDGVAELGIRWRRSTTEIWVFEEEFGSECIETLDGHATAAELVNAITSDERLSVASIPSDVSTIGKPVWLAKLLAYAWSGDEELRAILPLVVHLGEDCLRRLARSVASVDALLASLSDIPEVLERHGLEVDDLPADIEIHGHPTPASARRALRDAIAGVVREGRSIGREQQVVLDSFVADIQAMVEKLSEGRPRIRYPGAGYLPLPRSGRIQRYIEEFVLDHGRLPTGIHEIPAGTEPLRGEAPSFEVDFDVLRRVAADRPDQDHARAPAVSTQAPSNMGTKSRPSPGPGQEKDVVVLELAAMSTVDHAWIWDFRVTPAKKGKLLVTATQTYSGSGEELGRHEADCELDAEALVSALQQMVSLVHEDEPFDSELIRSVATRLKVFDAELAAGVEEIALRWDQSETD